MRNNVTPIVKQMIKQNNHKINISFPAIVVGVDKLKDGLIDVKPIVNYVNSYTGDSIKYPILRDIRVSFPSSKTSTICFPLVQGDTVNLIFQSVDIESFVSGNTQQHDSFTTGFGNLKNVVAYAGFTPFQQSCFNPENYQNEFDNQSLNIVHNKGTNEESTINISNDGKITLKSPVTVVVEAKEVQVLSDTIEANDAVINTRGDINIRGKSVNEFMLKHTHIGNQGSPISPPTI